MAVTVTAQWGLISYVKNFSYTGSAQTFTAPYAGKYKVELWGASGGKGGYQKYVLGGNAAYTSGTTTIAKNTNLYIYIGSTGGDAPGLYPGTSSTTIQAAGWNGGGTGGYDNANHDTWGGGGGGASDIRTTSGAWNNAASLRSRIMSAAGGGGGAVVIGQAAEHATCAHGSGLSNDRTCTQWNNTSISLTTNQTAGNAFGVGGNGIVGGEAGGGGGGGWYGGAVYTQSNSIPGFGGSSYISGHTGSVAVTSTSSSSPKSGCTTGTTTNSCSVSPYGYTFTNTLMIDGAGYKWTNTKGSLQAMPKPAGGAYASGTGHTGNGYAKITWLGV
jgi:hypothetical protein